jgi:hypothetical protein
MLFVRPCAVRAFGFGRTNPNGGPWSPRRRSLKAPQTQIDALQAIRRSAPPSYDQTIRVQSALAIAILEVAPIRMKNLASLRVGDDVVESRPGGVRQLVIPADEVKNKTPLEFEVSDFGEFLNACQARCRPLLAENPD